MGRRFDPARVPHALYRELFGPFFLIPVSHVIGTRHWGRPPDVEIATVFMPIMPHFSERSLALLKRYLKQQPEEVWQWVERQAEKYSASALFGTYCTNEFEAMLDALLWQWQDALTPCCGYFPRLLEAERLLWEIGALEQRQLGG